jgi:hypothetical protein
MLHFQVNLLLQYIFFISKVLLVPGTRPDHQVIVGVNVGRWFICVLTIKVGVHPAIIGKEKANLVLMLVMMLKYVQNY